MIDWSASLEDIRRAKSDAAADARAARAERQKLHAAIAAIRYRREHGLPLAERCQFPLTTGSRCNRWPWEHDGDWPCSPAGLWCPVLKPHGHKALCAAVKLEATR